MTDYLKELGFHIDERVSCQCIDDEQAWIGIVDRDSTGRYFLSADDVTYYPTETDKLNGVLANGEQQKTLLLNWLLDMDYDVYDDFLEIIDNIENGYAELKDYAKDPTVFDEEEIEFLKIDIEYWEEQIAKMKANFLKENKVTDWEKEVRKVNEWWKAKERLKYIKE